MIKRGFWVLAIGLSAIMSVGLLLWQLNMSVTQKLNVKNEITIDVDKGMPLTGLVNKLAQQEIIENSLFLKIYLKLNASQYPIKQGHYSLTEGETLHQFLLSVSRGKEKLYSITMVEGLTWKQWLNQLQNTVFIQIDKTESELLDMLGEQADSLEGLLLPETYHLRYNTTLSDFVQRMYNDMQQYLQEQWQNRQGMLPVNSPYETLILASIIEKETGLATERSRIAGVFVNRLREGMRLQTDPTVIYGLGDSFDGNLTREHLRQKTSHNTYRINGLPPTPIAMPGKDAIYAALNPLETNEYYFVARGDGSHQFSQTLKEHNAAVRKYQLGL